MQPASAKIIVAEDDSEMALHLARQLVELGNEVPPTVTSGSDAIRQSESQSPDLILLDIHIDAEFGGLQVADAVAIPVVYLLDDESEAALPRVRASRPYGYLIKPFSARELAMTVEMALERHFAEVALRESERRYRVIFETRKEAEERQVQLVAQLHQAQKMEAMGQLTGGMAHDFNNLLSIILGNLDFLSEKYPRDSDEGELVQAATDAAVKGAELVRRLLAFARRTPLAPRLTHLASVIEGAGELFRRTLGEHITLKIGLAEGLWPVMVDVAQLESAILNLAVNSRHAMPSGGTLLIEARNVSLDESVGELNPEVLPGDYLAISISDTGTGMKPEVLARVFEPFFTTKGAEGTGLGLSMVHGFVKQSGGHTKIYSEYGHGTTVRLYLPRAASIAADGGETVPASAMSLGHELILVVEDNAGVRELTVRRLQELGYRTIPAGDAADALAIIRGGVSFDLLFTDVVMAGGMDGIELASAARRLKPDLKILFTSGFTPAAASATMTEQFGSNLLPKPYRKIELAKRVRATLDNPV